MGIWDYISNIIAPFFANPIILYILVLIILGVDAYATTLPVFSTSSWLNAGDPQVVGSLNYTCTHPDALTTAISGVSYLKPFQACSTIATVNHPTGFFGGMLTGILRIAGLPEQVEVTSAQLFFVMLLTPIILWIATHQLGKR